MELKKEFLGSRIFVKKLGREVLVCDENKGTLMAHGLMHLFETKKENDKVKFADKPKHLRRIKTNNRKS
jgi:hypothetical protein